MKKLHLFIQIIIGISIIAFILNKLGLHEVFIVLKKTDMFYFVLACLSYLFLNLILASRLSYLLTKTGHEIKFRDVFLSHMGGMIIGDLTPGRSGYFLTPSILKKKPASLLLKEWHAFLLRRELNSSLRSQGLLQQ